VDTNSVQLLGVPRVQTAKTAGKHIWNRVAEQEENIRINLLLLGLLTHEDGTDTLSRNVGKQLPHDAA
jgi:hypothetical protein